jgi:hypothetical protein
MMMMESWPRRQRKRVLTVSALVVLGAQAGSALAGPLGGRVIGSAQSALGSDGARFGAWRATGHATTVYDVIERRAHTFADPAGCGAPVIGAGALLYTCSPPDPGKLSSAGLLDLRTGIFRQVVGPQPHGAEFRQWVAVGAHWLQALDQSPLMHSQASVFFRRDTGAQHDGSPPFGARRQPDLNRTGLVRSICSPLRAPQDGFGTESSDGYVPLIFSGRWSLNRGPAVSRAGGALTLQRCGSQHRRVLCRSGCLTPGFANGMAVWSDGDDLFTYELRRGLRRRYTPRAGSVAGAWRLGTRVLVAVDRESVSGPPLSIRVVGLSSRAGRPRP